MNTYKKGGRGYPHSRVTPKSKIARSEPPQLAKPQINSVICPLCAGTGQLPRGDLQVTFEEGTSAAWLYDLLKPHVRKVVVCDPRKIKSMREGNQRDKIDARRLAELLRLNRLSPVYHGEPGLRTLKEL